VIAVCDGGPRATGLLSLENGAIYQEGRGSRSQGGGVVGHGVEGFVGGVGGV